MPIVITILLFLFVLAAARYLGTPRQNARSALISAREPLSDDRLWELHYRDSNVPRELFATAWHQICKRAFLDETRLRPSDPLDDFARVSRERRSDDEWDDVLLEWSLRAKKLHVPVRPEVFKTVDDIVHLAVACLAAEGGAADGAKPHSQDVCGGRAT